MWRIKRGDQEFVAASTAELQQWACAGNVVATDYVFNPVLERWMYATEVAEIKAALAGRAQYARRWATPTWVTVTLVLLALGAIPALIVSQRGPGSGHGPETHGNRPPPAPIGAKSLEGLNALTRVKMGADLYDSYEQEGDALTIHLNPQLWNRLPPGEQRQLCDVLTRGKFMREMRVNATLLYVINTHVGTIGRNGNDQWFSPELQSLR